MSDIQDVAKAIAQATTNNIQNTTSTTNATVKRIEDGVAYVQFDGAETETPVQLTISANTGDTVKVTVSNGKAWIVGNTTAPPTDDSTAVQLFNELKAEKITADRIDVSDLFAQKIECKGTITGATLKGGTIEGTNIIGSNGDFSKGLTAGTETGDYVCEVTTDHFFAGEKNGETLGNGTYISNGLCSVKGEFTVENSEGTTLVGIGSETIEMEESLTANTPIYAKKKVELEETTTFYGDAVHEGNIYVYKNNTKVELFKAISNYFDDYIGDTGWRYPTIASSFTATSNTPRARRIGKTIVFTGAVNPSKKLSGSSDKVTICTLGDNYRPANQINILCQGSGQNKWLLTIETTGTVSFSRYGTTAAYVDTNTSTWLPFHTSWFVD